MLIQYTWKGEVPGEDMSKIVLYVEKHLDIKGTMIELPNKHRYSIRISNSSTDVEVTVTRS